MQRYTDVLDVVCWTTKSGEVTGGGKDVSSGEWCRKTRQV